MLTLERKESMGKWRAITIASAILLTFSAGVYASVLYFAPVFAPILINKPIEVGSLPAPSNRNNRIILPQIGINLSYTQGSEALENGAEWRTSNNGNPADGGNFVIAARYFGLQPTPIATISKSPFYNLNKMQNGDKVIVDYNGKRYGYEVYKSYTSTHADEHIEAKTASPTLTIVSIKDNDDECFVVKAKRLGEVAAN